MRMSSQGALPRDTAAAAESPKRPSLFQRASQIVARSSRSSRAINEAGFDEEQISVREGDYLETMESVTVRVDENLDSPAICELPRGVTMVVQFLGESSRRVKVESGNGISGWISLKTAKEQPLVMTCLIRLGDFEVGGVHEVKSQGLTMRSGEGLDSESTSEIRSGTVVKILEIGKMNPRRAKVEAGELIGWISLATNDGQYLIGKVEDQGVIGETPRSSPLRGSIGVLPDAKGDSQETKDLLEAARANNLTGMRQRLEGGRKSFLVEAPVKLSVNTSDVRGRTSLMHAAAFGHTSIVSYLIQHPEINVNGTDDMQKTALHHASKPSGSQGSSNIKADESREVIQMLIDAGARLEAKDHRGCTALMVAASRGTAHVITCLLELKADPARRDDSGFTAYDLGANADLPRSVLDLFGEDPIRGAARTDAVERATEVPLMPAAPAEEQEPSPPDCDGYPEFKLADSPSHAIKAPAKKKTTLVKKKAKAPKPAGEATVERTLSLEVDAADSSPQDTVDSLPQETGQLEESSTQEQESPTHEEVTDAIEAMASEKDPKAKPKAKKKMLVKRSVVLKKGSKEKDAWLENRDGLETPISATFPDIGPEEPDAF